MAVGPKVITDVHCHPPLTPILDVPHPWLVFPLVSGFLAGVTWTHITEGSGLPFPILCQSVVAVLAHLELNWVWENHKLTSIDYLTAKYVPPTPFLYRAYLLVMIAPTMSDSVGTPLCACQSTDTRSLT